MTDTTRIRASILLGKMPGITLVGSSKGNAYNNPLIAILDLCDEVNRLRAELVAERERNRWIPCSERLPDDKVSVLLTDYAKLMFMGQHYSADGKWRTDEGYEFYDEYETVTHWRPAPEIPDEVKK